MQNEQTADEDTGDDGIDWVEVGLRLVISSAFGFFAWMLADFRNAPVQSILMMSCPAGVFYVIGAVVRLGEIR